MPKAFLTIFALFWLFAGLLPAGALAQDITTDLSNHWTFEEGSGTTAADSVGSSNMTLTNMDPATDWVTGIVGSTALNFDGSNDYTTTTANYPQIAGSLMSISFWIQTTDTDGIVLSHSNDVDFFEVALIGGNISFITDVGPNESQARATSSTAVNDGNWHYVTATRSAARTNNIYVNTILEDTDSGSGSSSSINLDRPLYFGSENSSSANATDSFNGSIDDMRIYRRVLDPADINALYALGGGVVASSCDSSLEAVMKYNGDNNIMQYCNGTDWTGIGASDNGASILESDLVLHLEFEEGSGTDIGDSSGNGNDGTLVNADVSTSWVTGQVGDTALTIEGDDDYIEIPDDNSLDFGTGDFSISMWAYTAGSTNSRYLIYKGGGGGPNFRFGVLGTQLRYVLRDTSTLSEENLGNIGDFINGSWNHITLAFDRDEAVIGYVNGQEIGRSTAIQAIQASIDNSTVLRMRPSLEGTEDITVDDVRIYTRALDADEVQAIYSRTSGDYTNATCSDPAGVRGEMGYNFTAGVMQYCNGFSWINAGPAPLGAARTSVDDGLIGHWDFEDGAGTDAVDASLTGNDGILTNMDPATDWVAGQVGTNALDFDGSDDFVRVTDPIPDAQTALSFALWLKADSWASNWDMIAAQLMETGTGPGPVQFLYTNSTDDIRFIVRNSSGSSSSVIAAPSPVGTWAHYAGTYDGSTVSLYKDGALADSGSLSGGGILNSTNILAIGGKWQNGVYPTGDIALRFDGQIDDVRLYDRPLDSDEIAALASSAPSAPSTAQTCSSPDGVEGEIVYNDDENVMQYCGPVGWIEMR